jgi:DNA protecting protein DprA
VQSDTEFTARLLAAMDLLPAEVSDLSALLIRLGPRSLTEHIDEAGYDRDLGDYLRSNIDCDRLRYWQNACTRMLTDIPDAIAVSVISEDYPVNLFKCHDLPPVLFVRGNLCKEDAMGVAIIGSRKASTSELRAANDLARAAAEARLTVVSGLATGVDTIAHQKTLSVGGRTIAVLGCGLDRLSHNIELSDEIAKNGAVLTPYRPGAPATRSSLISRNAVISGLSIVSIVVAAGPQSGSISEAEAAMRQGRKVLLWAPSLERYRWARSFVSANAKAEFFDRPGDMIEFIRREVDSMSRDHETGR